MVKKPTRLQFSEEDLSDSHVRKAAERAEKAADKAEKAFDKASAGSRKSKLRSENDISRVRKEKLRFKKADTEMDVTKPSRNMLSRASGAAVSSKAHKSVSEYEEDNVGIQAAHQSEEALESAAYAADHMLYSKKLKTYNKADKLVKKSDAANVDVLYEKFRKEHPTSSTNSLSRWKQKQAIKKEYIASKAAKSSAGKAGAASKGTGKAAKGTKSIADTVIKFAKAHSKVLLMILVFALLLMAIAGAFSSCSAMFQGGTQVILGTSYTAEDEDILGANEDYSNLETALRNRIDNIESSHGGYDEYRYELDEINHNPYELASYLTVMFEDYTREEVQSTLQWLFDRQYILTITEEVEIRTRTETRTGTTTSTDPVTGETTTEEYEYEVEVEYEYYILNVKLINNGLNMVVENSGLSEDDVERYRLLLETRGNRSDLFGDDIYASPGGEYTDYDIPGEALTDERFANMVREAEKFLGYPYVWGGSSPSTSFDCSGFVSWVINNSGNGWSLGRQTANGLMGCCDIIRKSEAKPGDLIFFQGTYNTSGASHVGIYVGGGMMIHCGNPISYASIETNYWQSHYYCMGRIR